MQRAKTLTKLFKALAELLADEAERNSAFAEKLDGILAPLPKPTGKRTGKGTLTANDVPDVYAEYQSRGEDEFRFWLRGLDVLTLKGIVKVNGFDPSDVSRRWVEVEKFVPFVTGQVKARLRRGSGFMTLREPGGNDPQGPAN
jgi:hypothetical protein